MGVIIIRALFPNNIVRWFLRERGGSGGPLVRNLKQGPLGGAWDLPNPPMLLVLFITPLYFYSVYMYIYIHIYIYIYAYTYVVFVRTEEAPHSRSNPW